MRVLDRKVLRDLWNLRGAVAAICLVMASGTATFVMSLSTLDSLRRTQTNFYRQSRFGDPFRFSQESSPETQGHRSIN